MKSTTIAEKLNAELMCERRNEIVSLLTQSIECLSQADTLLKTLSTHGFSFDRNTIYSPSTPSNKIKTIENLTNGSVRGVLPCKGIEPSGVFGTRLLRQEAGLASDSYVVPQGFAKSQEKGLAYLVQKPLNVQPQMQRQFFNVNQFARASAPPFTPTKA